MSIARPLSRAFAPRSGSSRIPRSFLHSSTRRRKADADKPKKTSSSPNTSLTQVNNNGKLTDGNRQGNRELPAYTEQEYEQLKKKYTPQQIQAIREGEKAINSQDMLDQGIVRGGAMTLDYVDDFATIRPVVDKQPRAPETNYDPKLRFKTEDELAKDVGKWVLEASSETEDVDPVQWREFVDNTRLTEGLEAAEKNPPNFEAPALRKMSDPLVRAQARSAKADTEDDEMAVYYQRLEKITGLSMRTMKQLRVKTMVRRRVVNQTRMGKVASAYFLTVAGNKNGLLGIGEGKGREPEDARRQSIMNAIRNLTPILRYENRTIFGDVKGKVGATELELFTRPPGMLFAARVARIN